MSSTELVMIEAACFQLRAAIGEIADDAYASTLRIALNVLAANIAAAKQSLNASKVSDIEFALNDLIAVAAELPPLDSERLEEPLNMLRNDVATLHKLTALPADVVDAIAVLREKLKFRRHAIEQQTYREDVGDLTLPHPPETLRAEAVAIREKLHAAGFDTPSLDVLIEQPTEFLFHSINELLDELEVIVGS